MTVAYTGYGGVSGEVEEDRMCAGFYPLDNVEVELENTREGLRRTLVPLSFW